ncbi:MAG: bifunctional diaminohydroxyphosphoribosylaminopyrimidine deaminase/5-amino-6-(5-phosphoribosylamino)uracil reductase RibD, partial [Flavobacteriales bacterium]
MGLAAAIPNPSVGCVIVHDNQIIGEGFTSAYGGNHAEVNAINSVENQDLLPDATLYVSLEPCAHFGKTPPCANLILEKNIKKVVVATVDPFAEVNGLGITRLRENGVDVKVGILGEQARESNKRFFTFHEKKRPYIILKWAETNDGFVDDLKEYETESLNIQYFVAGWYSNTSVEPLSPESDTMEDILT